MMFSLPIWNVQLAMPKYVMRTDCGASDATGAGASGPSSLLHALASSAIETPSAEIVSHRRSGCDGAAAGSHCEARAGSAA